MAAIVVAAVLGPKGGAISDATTCSQWGSANQNQQTAYARLYTGEHGRVAARWGTGTSAVLRAINAGCIKAYGEDVDDTTSLVQAVSGDF